MSRPSDNEKHFIIPQSGGGITVVSGPKGIVIKVGGEQGTEVDKETAVKAREFAKENKKRAKFDKKTKRLSID